MNERRRMQDSNTDRFTDMATLLDEGYTIEFSPGRGPIQPGDGTIYNTMRVTIKRGDKVVYSGPDYHLLEEALADAYMSTPETTTKPLTIRMEQVS